MVVVRLELFTLAPCEVVASVHRRITEGVVGDRLPVKTRQQIFPAGVRVGVGFGRKRRYQSTDCVRIFFLFKNIPRRVIGIRVRAIENRVVLADKLIHTVVGVAGNCASVAFYFGDISVVVVGVGEGVLGGAVDLSRQRFHHGGEPLGFAFGYTQVATP